VNYVNKAQYLFSPIKVADHDRSYFAHADLHLIRRFAVFA